MPSPGPSMRIMEPYLTTDRKRNRKSIAGMMGGAASGLMIYLFSEVKVSFLHALHGCGFANRCGAWMLSLFRDWIAPIPQCLDCGVGALYSGR